MKRTRTYNISSSKTCSAQSTVLPWTPGYRLPGLGNSVVVFLTPFLFFIGPPPVPPADHRETSGTAAAIRVALPAARTSLWAVCPRRPGDLRRARALHRTTTDRVASP